MRFLWLAFALALSLAACCSNGSLDGLGDRGCPAPTSSATAQP